MANGHAHEPLFKGDSNMPSWLTPKVDAAISTLLTYLSMAVGGYGLYSTSQSWHGLPIILIGLLLWGISCVGLRRLIEFHNSN